MIKINSATLAALAILILATISLADWGQSELAAAGTQQPAQAATVIAGGEPEWVASAPGRVEPMGGSIAIGATMSGRVTSVLVANEVVGKTKQLVGKIMGSDKTKIEGKVQEVGGGVQVAVGRKKGRGFSRCCDQAALISAGQLNEAGQRSDIAAAAASRTLRPCSIMALTRASFSSVMILGDPAEFVCNSYHLVDGSADTPSTSAGRVDQSARLVLAVASIASPAAT